MDLLCNSAIVPYGQVFRDRRGHRHAISWLTEAYLREKGLGLDGRRSPGTMSGPGQGQWEDETVAGFGAGL